MIDPTETQRFIIRNNSRKIDFYLGTDEEPWIIPDELQSYVETLALEKNLNPEEKILEIYKKICLDYIYDDNVLSYLKRDGQGEFWLPDEYGRKTNTEWKNNRAKHNRRNCFEVSRVLAKSIKGVLGNTSDYDVCILWDESNTHYFVGLACDEYSMSLDVDDFNSIKDLTRMKTDLALEGINIFEDPNGKFKKVLEKFNENRSDSATEHIIEKTRGINNKKNNTSYVETNETKNIQSNEIGTIEAEDIEFFKYAVEILKYEYNLDSQGIFEYMEEIARCRIGKPNREKVWKKVTDNSGTSERYTRCLIVNVGENKYLIDGTEDKIDKIFRRFDEEELYGPNAIFKPCRTFSREWEDDKYFGE